MVRTLVVLVGILVAAAPVGLAQNAAGLAVQGQRVRIHRQGNKDLVGVLVSGDSTQLTISSGSADTLVVRRSTVSRIDRSIGRKSLAGKGAIFGAGFGLVGGVTAAAIACDVYPDEMGSCVVGVGLVSTVLGAAAGAIVGAFLHTDRWERVSLTSLEVGPSGPGGKGVAIEMRFSF